MKKIITIALVLLILVSFNACHNTTEPTDINEPIEPTDVTEPTDINEPIEPTDINEPIEPTDVTEPVDVNAIELNIGGTIYSLHAREAGFEAELYTVGLSDANDNTFTAEFLEYVFYFVPNAGDAQKWKLSLDGDVKVSGIEYYTTADREEVDENSFFLNSWEQANQISVQEFARPASTATVLTNFDDNNITRITFHLTDGTAVHACRLDICA